MEEKLEVSETKKSQVKILAAFPVLLAFSLSCLLALGEVSPCGADTFTHRQTGEVLHGYIAGRAKDGETIANTKEKDQVKLDLSQWQIVTDRLGRNNKVIVLTIEDEIGLEIETQALEREAGKVSNEGPLFILFEIDTPGGRGDLTQRSCGAITQIKNCPTVAFVKGGKYGGALSGGAAVVLACDKIYMADNTVIGAATAITISENGRPESLKEAFGEEVGEKFASAWRAYLASLAERKGRPGLLARAMVDRNTEVIEVADANQRLFIDPVNKKPRQHLVHTWSKKGLLLTLTAAEAVECGIADKVVSSRRQLLSDLGAADANVVLNSAVQDARIEMKRAGRQVNRIRKSIDLKIEQLKYRQSRQKALGILRSAKSEFQTLIRLAKRYPDLELDVQSLENELNSIEAAYQDAKRK
jgi:ATP-dependent protease ClpP protease subunit